MVYSDIANPIDRRARWITKKNPPTARMEWAEAEAQKYEEIIKYDPDADVDPEDAGEGGGSTVARGAGRPMHIAEAVQVLHLVEPTEAHVVDVRLLSMSHGTALSGESLIPFSILLLQRYNHLIGANTFKGAPAYLQEKLEAAQVVALKFQREGRLVDFIKKRPQEAAAETAAAAAEAPGEAASEQAEASDAPKSDTKTQEGTEGESSSADQNAKN